MNFFAKNAGKFLNDPFKAIDQMADGVSTYFQQRMLEVSRIAGGLMVFCMMNLMAFGWMQFQSIYEKAKNAISLLLHLPIVVMVKGMSTKVWEFTEGSAKALEAETKK